MSKGAKIPGGDPIPAWDESRGARSEGAWSPEAPADPPDPPADPSRYRPGLVVGRGGMGVVRAAEDTLLGRDVAIKELDPGRASDAGAAARLAREAAITARLDHPGVVAVYDAGRLADGRPFYAMRLVRGRSLQDALDAAPDDEARRALIRPLLAAAEAVAAAHRAGMVHRDLKPSNILIGEHGETQVVDWGVAAPTPEAAGRWADLRGPEGVVGTPAYVAPEQARGDPPDPRHDVWSLGATLYALLAGEPPRGRVVDLAQAVEIAPRSLQNLAPDAPPELAAIANRAMSADPAARYPDAGAFAGDLLAWFEGRRVAAFPYRPLDLLTRVLRAWRTPLIVGAAGLVAALGAAGVGWLRTTEALDRARLAEADARKGWREAEEQLARTRMEQAAVAVVEDARHRAEPLAAEALAVGDYPLARGVLMAFARSPRPLRLETLAGPDCLWSAFAPGGAWLLCGTAEGVARWQDGSRRWLNPAPADGGMVLPGGEVYLWDGVTAARLLDPDSGEIRRALRVRDDQWVQNLPPRHVFLDGALWEPRTPTPARCGRSVWLVIPSPDSREIATFCGDGTLWLGPPEAPDRVHFQTTIKDAQSVVSLSWTPDGLLVAGTLRGSLRLLDPRTGAELRAIDTALGIISQLAISADGATAAAGGAEGGIGLWNLHTGAWLGELPAARPRVFAFEPDGTLRIHEGAIQRWAVRGRAPYRLQASGGLAELALSDDGALIALAAGDGTARVARLSDGEEVLGFDMGDGVAKAVALSPGGRQLVASAVTIPPAVHVQLLPGATPTPLPDPRRLRRVAWLPKGGILGLDLDGSLYRWATPEGPRVQLPGARPRVDLERSGDDAVMLLSDDGEIARLEGDATRSRPLARLPEARAVAGSAERVAAITSDSLVLYDGQGLELRRLAPTGSLLDVAVSPDSRWIAVSRLDGRVLVFDAEGALRAELPGHTERVVALEFSRDSRTLASASWDGNARIWDLGVLSKDRAALVEELRLAWPAASLEPASLEP